MPGELPHNRGLLSIEGIGYVAELKTFDPQFTGDPTAQIALEGTVGSLPPLGKGMNVTGTVFMPAVKAAYSVIMDHWFRDRLFTATVEFGNARWQAEGRLNAPSGGESASELSFEFIGHHLRKI